MSEYQVKALFLLNFIKYVNWPAERPLGRSAPIVIGVLGQDNFNDSLTSAVEGKTIDGRSIVIKHVSEDDDLERLRHPLYQFIGNVAAGRNPGQNRHIAHFDGGRG